MNALSIRVRQRAFALTFLHLVNPDNPVTNNAPSLHRTRRQSSR